MTSTDQTFCSHFPLRGTEYIITMTYNEEAGSNFSIEVLDNITLNQWAGVFDVEYIENLTHKTGNYKQFSIFSNMLKTALLKQSESVTLDVLTYADLELLRQRRTGSRTNVDKQSTTTTTNLNSKRYLILIYTVEFDRIHYPLPLHLKQKMNDTSLHQTIGKLKAEVKQLKDEIKNTAGDFENLDRDFETVVQDDKEMTADWTKYHLENNGAIGMVGAKKEVSLLKAVIKKLETELLKEKTLHQRVLRKRGQEFRELQQELREVRTSERQLRIRVKTLTNELAVHKRNQMRSTRVCRRDQSSSCESLNCRPLRNRSSSRERSVSRERAAQLRDRSSSRERKSSKERVYTRRTDSSLNSSRHSGNSTGAKKNSYLRSRTPSPNTKDGRFDPTAYVKDRERKLDEVRARKHWHRIARTGSADRKTSPGTRPFRRKVDSYGDSSDGGMSECSGSSYYKVRHAGSRRPASKYTYLSSPEAKQPHIVSSIKDNSKSIDPQKRQAQESGGLDILSQSLEIAEIDAKLERLQQQLMKSSLS